jgi:hypothetical protein
MSPSFPHAVFTSENCLAVGNQIYTAAHLGRSLEGLKVQEDHPNISNEDLHDSDYSTLAVVKRNAYPEKNLLMQSEHFPKNSRKHFSSRWSQGRARLGKKGVKWRDKSKITLPLISRSWQQFKKFHARNPYQFPP